MYEELFSWIPHLIDFHLGALSDVNSILNDDVDATHDMTQSTATTQYESEYDNYPRLPMKHPEQTESFSNEIDQLSKTISVKFGQNDNEKKWDNP